MLCSPFSLLDSLSLFGSVKAWQCVFKLKRNDRNRQKINCIILTGQPTHWENVTPTYSIFCFLFLKLGSNYFCLLKPNAQHTPIIFFFIFFVVEQSIAFAAAPAIVIWNHPSNLLTTQMQTHSLFLSPIILWTSLQFHVLLVLVYFC